MAKFRGQPYSGPPKPPRQERPRQIPPQAQAQPVAVIPRIYTLLQNHLRKKYAIKMARIPTLKTLSQENPLPSGEYERTANTVRDMFGHDPHGITAWVGVNNAISPSSHFNTHSANASRIVSKWLEAGKPQDSHTLSRIAVPHAGERLNHVIAALQNAQSPEMLPIPQTPVDIHLSRNAYQPTLDSIGGTSDITRQVNAHLTLPGEPIHPESLHYLPLKSEFVRTLKNHPNFNNPSGTSIIEWLKNLHTQMSADPHNYLAFKASLDDSAKQLGWKPEELHESLMTNLVGHFAHTKLGMPLQEVQRILTNESESKGWKPHESIYLPQLVHPSTKRGFDANSLARLGKEQRERATASSRPGILPERRTPPDADVIARGPSIAAQHAAKPLREALAKHIGGHGLPVQLAAKYDAPLDFGPAQDRAVSSNQQPLIEGLRQALQNSGIIPHTLSPALHDYAGQVRTSLIAIGQYANPNAPKAGAAWMGLLGRQPGMLAFKGNPQGKDSIYHFTHHNADIVRRVLQEAGVFNRTIVPEKAHYGVYVYDPGNTLRTNVAKALGQMRAQAVEWRGDGEVLGGKMDDMGRGQYRDTINAVEGAEQQPQRMARNSNDIEGVFRYLSSDNNHLNAANWGRLADAFRDEGNEGTANALMHFYSNGEVSTNYDPKYRGKQLLTADQPIHKNTRSVLSSSYTFYPKNIGPMCVYFTHGTHQEPANDGGSKFAYHHIMSVHKDPSEPALGYVSLSDSEYGNVCQEFDPPPKTPSTPQI
jgi:hypothetical protein